MTLQSRRPGAAISKLDARHGGRRSRSAAELGQTTIEYVLMLFAVVTFVTLVSRNFIIPVLSSLSSSIQNSVSSAFSPQNLHKFPLKPSK